MLHESCSRVELGGFVCGIASFAQHCLPPRKGHGEGSFEVKKGVTRYPLFGEDLNVPDEHCHFVPSSDQDFFFEINARDAGNRNRRAKLLCYIRIPIVSVHYTLRPHQEQGWWTGSRSLPRPGEGMLFVACEFVLGMDVHALAGSAAGAPFQEQKNNRTTGNRAPGFHSRTTGTSQGRLQAAAMIQIKSFAPS